MNADEIIRRWAEYAYGLEMDSVARVHLNEWVDDGWSEYTPGEGAIIDVLVYDADDKLLHSDRRLDHVALIREIAAFAGNLALAITQVWRAPSEVEHSPGEH